MAQTALATGLLLTACTGTAGTPRALVPTATSALPAAAITNPVPEEYEQGLPLFDYVAEQRGELTENSVRQEEGYRVHDIHYPSPKGGDVPAYLFVPEEEGCLRESF